jgi:hypothetical protein
VAWDHVLRQHPDMVDALKDVVLTIEHPTYREPDVRPGRERLFRPGGSQGWIRVVTEFQGDIDRVVTAFSQSNDPRPGVGR